MTRRCRSAGSSRAASGAIWGKRRSTATSRRRASGSTWDAELRAVVIREHGGPEVLRFEERPVPDPGPRELRIRVRAVGLNHLDLWVRNGIAGHSFPLPIVPGCDVAGVVERLGPGASGVAVGDEVVVAPGVSCGRCSACRAGENALCRTHGILGESRDGGCQEYLVVGDDGCFPKPPGLDFAEAAAVPL